MDFATGGKVVEDWGNVDVNAKREDDKPLAGDKFGGGPQSSHLQSNFVNAAQLEADRKAAEAGDFDSVQTKVRSLVPEDAVDDHRTLYERLKEVKDKKDEEWKEKNNMFRPPKAIDEEDLAWYAEKEQEKERQRQELEELDKKAYEKAMLERQFGDQKSQIRPATVIVKPAEKPKETKPIVQIAVKEKKKKKRKDSEGHVKSPKKKKGLGLVSYGGDEDSA